MHTEAAVPRLKVVTAFTVDPDILERADRYWRMTGMRSRSALVQEALLDYLDRHQSREEQTA